MKTVSDESSRSILKFPRVAHPSFKRFIGMVLVVFVVTGTFVGYVNQFQTAPGLQPPGSGVVLQPYAQLGPAPSAVTYLSVTVASTTGVSPGSYTTSFGGRMVELQAYLTIQVDDVRSGSGEAMRLASILGGYVAESSFDESASVSNMVLRVPQENYTLALRELSILGKVKAQSISSNDVTEQYVNLEAQLNAYKTEESTLLRILNSSNTVRDALATEDAISQVQAQINQIEGQLRVMQRLVTFATINIQLMPPTKGPSLDFGEAFQSALLSLYIVVKGLMILGASLLPIAVLSGIVYYPYRRFSRRRGTKVEAKVNDAG